MIVTTVLPPELFINHDATLRVFDIDSIFGELDKTVADAQEQHRPLMKEWQKKYDATTLSALQPPYREILGWRKQGRLVVLPNLALKCKIMFHIHDAVGPKHPNLPKMLHQTTQLYWWPDMKAWVTRYMENCKQCHHNPATARTASPTITSLRSRVRKTQEQYRATLEKWGLLYSIDGKVAE